MVVRILLGGLIAFAALLAVVMLDLHQDVNATESDAYRDKQMHAAMAAGQGRMFFQAFPKGADLHNHLTGAVYAETWLDWAAEDGLCVDVAAQALRDPMVESCADKGWITADAARSDENIRRDIINGLSMRSFVAENGWSGHNQFFATFSRMARKDGRLGDMLAAALDRAGYQNIAYLELMETPLLPELFPLTGGLALSGDPVADYATLMASSFGAEFENLVQLAKDRFTAARARANAVLRCGTQQASPGCDVEIRWLYQVIREFSPAMVYAQFALGWRVIADHSDVVGLNLVAPEDGYIALRDYNAHMAQIGYLQASHGAQNVALHAGELTLGLVRPKQLRFHIRNAIEIAGAKRIGHGIDIPYETDAHGLLQQMARDKILVEINLTSNDVILGVKGADHPLGLYRKYGVPFAISTDDEGVSRIDLSHEYERAVVEQQLDYASLKQASRDSLTYSFLAGDSLWDHAECVQLVQTGVAADKLCGNVIAQSDKARIQWQLEDKIRSFEQRLLRAHRHSE